MPSKNLQRHTPLSVLTPSHPPFIPPPRIFGCLCFVHNYDSDDKKLNPRSIRAVFLSYSPIHKGYQCFDPNTGRWYVSRDVTFIEYESYFHYSSLQGERQKDEEYSQEQEIKFYDFLHCNQECSPEHGGERKTIVFDVTGPKESNLYGRVYSRRNKQNTIQYHTSTDLFPDELDPTLNEPNLLVKETSHISDESTNIRKEDIDQLIAQRKGTSIQHPIDIYVSYSHLSENYKCFISSLSSSLTPKNVDEAKEDPRKAMQEEMFTLLKNDT